MDLRDSDTVSNHRSTIFLTFYLIGFVYQGGSNIIQSEFSTLHIRSVDNNRTDNVVLQKLVDIFLREVSNKGHS